MADKNVQVVDVLDFDEAWAEFDPTLGITDEMLENFDEEKIEADLRSLPFEVALEREPLEEDEDCLMEDYPFTTPDLF